MSSCRLLNCQNIGYKREPKICIRENNVVENSLYAIGQVDIGRVAAHYFQAYNVLYTNGIAYDIHSISELGQNKAAPEWLTFPLPGETNTNKAWMPKSFHNKTFPYFRSPKTKTGLAYLDDIYVVTDRAFPDRMKNVMYMFNRQRIPTSTIQWKFDQRNRSKCDGVIHNGTHHTLLNLTPGPIGNLVCLTKKLITNLFVIYLGDATQQRYCAVTVHHVKIWHEIAKSNATLSLVLEDDAVFVPFFKEKFDRFVYTAIRTGALKINPTHCASPRSNISANEWINQDPAFIIGACANLRDSTFSPENRHAFPRLSTHKERFSRCSHAYVLNRCSAQGLLRQMYSKKIPFHIIDWLMIYLGETSRTLQPFWLDPAIAYQGSQATDLQKISTFSRSMTQENEN